MNSFLYLSHVHVNSAGLDIESMIKLQKVLRSKGYDVGKVDGILGAKTRQAVRSVQLEFGLSADSWPTKELLRKLLIN